MSIFKKKQINEYDQYIGFELLLSNETVETSTPRFYFLSFFQNE